MEKLKVGKSIPRCAKLLQNQSDIFLLKSELIGTLESDANYWGKPGSLVLHVVLHEAWHFSSTCSTCLSKGF